MLMTETPGDTKENSVSKCNFVHLHVHSVYSFLDGYNRLDVLAKRVKEMGQTACAVTDHNTLAGIPIAQEEFEKQGVKLLPGLEGYFTYDMNELAKDVKIRKADAQAKAIKSGKYSEEDISKMKAKELTAALEPFMYDTTGHHILFIAKNTKGWRNLVKLQSEAARRCTFNGRFHCDMDLIREYHEDLICTAACISSYSAHKILAGDEAGARWYLDSLREIFGEDFYLEIQPLNIKKQRIVNLFYMQYAKETGCKCVATNDSHWTYREDYDDHDTLLCIGTGKKKNDTDRMRYSNDFWMKTEEEMKLSFTCQNMKMEEEYAEEEIREYTAFCEEAMAETMNIADKVDSDIKLGSDKPLFSEVKVPNGHTPEEYLNYLCWGGLYKYLAKHPECDRKTYENRIKEELDVILPKGFAPYFLAVYEYTNWCANNDIVTGPGRGSAAGSLALFSIGVTKNVDPIKEDLIFSRFLTADRKDPPDIDLDFMWSRRDDVIHHLEDYYGVEKVAHIGTFSALGVKSGLKDICRVFEVPFLESNNISKAIDEISDAPGLTFKDLDEMANGDDAEKEAYKKFHELELKYPEYFKLARKFEGIPRGMGVHASGVLVTPMPVTDLFPVRYKDGTAITLWTGPQLEHFGAIKYDILGLRTLDIIQKTINAVDDLKDINELYDKAKIDDEKVWQYIADKNTDAVFQIESGMMKGIVDRIKPSCFADLGAICAIGRPGPISIGLDKKYADVKHGKAQIEYPIRGCEDILDETFGSPVYQEQLMFISKKISGFDDMQADSITRKVLGKKKIEMFPMMKRCHVYGKKNCEGPEGWEQDDNAPWYDPKGKYGKEIPGALVNGYSAKEVLDYFDKIEGFAKYCLTA